VDGQIDGWLSGKDVFIDQMDEWMGNMDDGETERRTEKIYRWAG
jgi:hypothetical protein